MVGLGLTTHWPNSILHLILYFPCKGRPSKKWKGVGHHATFQEVPSTILWGALASLKEKPLVPPTQQSHPAPFFLFIFFLSCHDIVLLQTVCSCTGKERLDRLDSPAWRHKHYRFQQGWKMALDLHPEDSFKPTTQSMNGISCGHSCDSRSWGKSWVVPQRAQWGVVTLTRRSAQH